MNIFITTAGTFAIETAPAIYVMRELFIIMPFGEVSVMSPLELEAGADGSLAN